MKRIRKKNWLLLSFALICLAPCQMSAQVFLTEWTPAGEGNWNDDSNWVDILGDNFVPDAALTEGAVIDSGGTAVVLSLIHI